MLTIKNYSLFAIMYLLFMGLVFSQDISLISDNECDQLALSQVLGSSIFWKVFPKKKITLVVEAVELSNPNKLYKICEISLDKSFTRKILSITCYKDGDKQWLQYRLINSNAIIVGKTEVPMSTDESLSFDDYPERINLYEKTPVKVNVQRRLQKPIVINSLESEDGSQVARIYVPNRVVSKYYLLLRAMTNNSGYNTDIR
jgi:hypothetical protein